MGAYNALLKILADKIVISLSLNHGKYCCKLQETESDYSFELWDVPKDAIIIKCDKFPNTGEVFFKGKENECKRADYALVSESDKTIMIFELKRSNGSTETKNITAQLKGATCILNYCASISSFFLDEHGIFDGFIYKYYKGIHNLSQKRAFGDTAKIDNTKPDTARIIPGKYSSYKWLLN